MKKEENKYLDYWKANAEEDYMRVPISVLRYITELEAAVKNCSIPDVVGQSEHLKAVQKLKDFAYEVCPLHREDDLEEIVGSL